MYLLRQNTKIGEYIAQLLNELKNKNRFLLVGKSSKHLPKLKARKSVNTKYP